MNEDIKKYPGNLAECDKCMFTLKQCEMMTSCIPCRCEAYQKYLETENAAKN